MEASDKIRVLQIAGFGWSRLLIKVLGQADGFFLVSETRSIWEYGSVGNEICGCEARFADCVVTVGHRRCVRTWGRWIP